MLKSLYPRVDWSRIQFVGLDMDGTLYDEEEFISQVYDAISLRFSSLTNRNSSHIYEWMLARWRKKGSSYSHIFEEVLSFFGVDEENKKRLLTEALIIFREYNPKVKLSQKTETILEEINMNYKLFLVTDGSAMLQTKKFDSLSLGRWISVENVGITGRYGPDFAKPSTKIIKMIDCLHHAYINGNVVYFGDREIDAEFSSNAGFDFVYVKCMIPTVGLT